MFFFVVVCLEYEMKGFCFRLDFLLIQNLCQTARGAGVPVILDAGGMDAPIPPELLMFVDILSPNETELARLTGMPTDTFEEIGRAVDKCYEMVSGKVIIAFELRLLSRVMFPVRGIGKLV